MGETRRRALKIVIQITCQLLWVAGLVVGLSGMYLLLNYRHNGIFFTHTYIILPACLALASATLLLASGGLGIWVSLRKSALLQGVVDSELAPFSSVFQRYTGRCQDPYSDAVDATQKELQCCGIYDYRDWLATPWFNHSGRGSVPHSCCNYTYHTCNGTLELPGLLYPKVYTHTHTPALALCGDPKGCQVKLEEALLFVLHLIIWSSLAVALVETVGFVSVAQLMRDQPLLEYGILDREYGILDREYGILDREWA
ncbi:tetraspanin 37 isoform X4 [Oncorhynchus nerka]|uniref:tetraspanin 37 isoform X4 n=1 Tax=Oncorhynchus nerka TaxID=8023 RepID=UPI0011321F95|nr:tetraspanin-3-like isoform X3 [Oncorhynchus nerka]